MSYKLQIELIPRSSFFKNVRSEVSKSEWDKIRKKIYAQAGYRCEICDGKGSKHPVECHEIFEYDEENRIQKLARLIALCPACHEVCHIGLARVRGRYEEALNHFCKVNDVHKKEAERYIDNCFKTWKNRSSIQWTLDLTKLQDYI